MMPTDIPTSEPPRRILVVDDNQLERLLIRHRLRMDHVTLIEAGSGIQAIELAKSVEPDLILLDLHLPDLFGFEVIRELKDDPITRPIPVIFISGMSESDDKVRALDLGAVDFICKPFDPAELRARIRVALRMKSYYDLLEKQAQLDALTGLANRHSLEARLDAEWSAARRRGGPLSLMIIDLDHFKRINDRFGHAAGDEALKRAAGALKSIARVSDFVARFGGEEFVLIAPECDLEGAINLAERAREQIESVNLRFDAKRHPLTASAGVSSTSLCVCVEGEPGPRVLLEQADRALYEAKASGRNTVRAWTSSLIHASIGRKSASVSA